MPFRISKGAKIRSGSAEGPSRACQDGFRHSLFPYLALHPTSHHLFFMLSHWVSVSAGNPAIAVARKVGVLGAPEIENGAKISSKNCFFSIFSKITKKHEIDDSFTLLRFLASTNPSFFNICSSIFHVVFRNPFWRAFVAPRAPI